MIFMICVRGKFNIKVSVTAPFSPWSNSTCKRQSSYNNNDTLRFKCQPHKMVKHTQTIRWQIPTNCLSVFDHFVGLAIKGLKHVMMLNVAMILH